MGDYKYLVHQFQSQESARWKNKIENNRLANEIGGKGGIEYERAFHIRSLDKERRKVQEDLDLIRSHGRRKGVRRSSKPEIITTSLNPPLHKPEAVERDRRPPAGNLGRRGTLAGYVDIPPIQRTLAGQESKTSGVQKTTQDYMHVHAGQAAVTKAEPIFFTRFDPSDNKSPAILQTEGVPETPLANPVVYHKRQLVQFVDEDRLTHNKGKLSQLGLGSVRSLPGSSGVPDSVLREAQARQYKPGSAINTAALSELNVNTARENAARRLTESVGGTTTTTSRAEEGGPGEHGTAEQDGQQQGGIGQQEAPDGTMAARVVTESGAKKMDPTGNTKQRRGSKTESVSEILKASKFDSDKYNPDGSLRTKHQVPAFDDAYEQARRARYIRSKERSELDRELSINEVFDKQDDSVKQSDTA